MSDPTLADELTAVWQGVRPIFEDAFYADTCEVRRDVSPGLDEVGNALPAVPTTVEVSRCSLGSLNQMGQGERVIADRLGWATPFSIELPVDAIATPADTIRVNGDRIFHVGGVVTEGEWAISTTAIVEERG